MKRSVYSICSRSFGQGVSGIISGYLRSLFCASGVVVLCSAAQPGWAVDSAVNPKMRYDHALKLIQESGILELSELPTDYFARFDWVGKTALINLVCHSSAAREPLCQSAVTQGLGDDALVVRDHALRTVLADRKLSGSFKETVAQKIVDDDRNYRNGKAFWIVQNAQSYLRLSRKNSAPE